MALVLFCGQSSYPRSDSATANRYRALAEMTASLGYEVVFLNRHPPLRVGETPFCSPEFRTINVSGAYRKANFLGRQLSRLCAGFCEGYGIYRLAREKSISAINIYTQYSIDLIFYYLISRIVGTRCIVHVVEQRSQIDGRRFGERLNDRLYERAFLRLFDRFVAISSMTRDIILKVNHRGKVVIVPPVCSFSDIAAVEPARADKPYFLYCASLAYEDVAWFVIQSFHLLNTIEFDLVLVLSGTLTDRIREACQNDSSIKLFSHLGYGDLLSMYKGAHALLIPLRDTAQDRARFPHKVSEYLASGRPIISCKVGDMSEHFVDGVSAFLADNYDAREFAALMRLSVASETNTQEIAKQGYTTGAALFDVKSQALNLEVLMT